MKLTFDSFVSYIVFGFFSLYAIIFWKMYDSVHQLNQTMAAVVYQAQDHDTKIKDHEFRLREVEKQK